MFTINGKYTTARVMIDEVEPKCVSQITHFTNHPAFTNPVSIMPDCHYGNGSCIGFTMEITDKIIPNVVGVDIGCGIKSINISNDLGISLEEFDRKVRKAIPFGVNIHNKSILNMERNFPWKKTNDQAVKFAMAYYRKFGVSLELPNYNMNWFMEKIKEIGGDLKRMINSIGTLGGGNHFLEVGKSINGSYWITVHSGSRNFGKRICEYWQNRAKKFLLKDKKQELQTHIDCIKETFKHDTIKIKEEIQNIKNKLNLNNQIDMKGCEWLEDNNSIEYLFDMIFSQMYAQVNREYMARIIEKIIGTERIDEIETVHNFIDFHDFIIRKGAIRSYENERMVIPFNMRDGILICEGKSNKEWNCSAPHGAGRIMSRSQANKSLNVKEFENQMNGIYSTSVNKGTLDEAPGAYKDSKIIEESIQPTATIIKKIKPVLNMKSGGEFRRKKGKK